MFGREFVAPAFDLAIPVVNAGDGNVQRGGILLRSPEGLARTQRDVLLNFRRKRGDETFILDRRDDVPRLLARASYLAAGALQTRFLILQLFGVVTDDAVDGAAEKCDERN